MLSRQKPPPEALRRFLTAQASLPFSYAAVGATATTPPAGFVVDHRRIELGQGEAVFQAARAALRRWEQFQLGWVEAWPTDTPLQAGQVVAILGRALGLWWRNACRIVYVVDQSSPTHKFGFAYGTLPGHVESGEELFLIEWNPTDNRVWFEILAFSSPHHFLTRLSYPLVRRAQKRFGREAAARMLQAVQSAVEASANPVEPNASRPAHPSAKTKACGPTQ